MCLLIKGKHLCTIRLNICNKCLSKLPPEGNSLPILIGTALTAIADELCLDYEVIMCVMFVKGSAAGHIPARDLFVFFLLSHFTV